MNPFWQNLRFAASAFLKRSPFIPLIIVTLVPGIGANTTSFHDIQQDNESPHIGPIETKYDRQADTTTVHCKLVELGEGAPKLIVQANASFRGREPNETVKFWLGLASYKGGATRRTERSFENATTLYLTMDSERLELRVKDYHDDFYELNRLFAESARAEISREDLNKMLDARNLDGKWGDIEFKLSEAALASLKDFISRQVFTPKIR